MRSRVSADLGKAGLCLDCATGALLISFHFNGLTTKCEIAPIWPCEHHYSVNNNVKHFLPWKSEG